MDSILGSAIITLIALTIVILATGGFTLTSLLITVSATAIAAALTWFMGGLGHP